MPFGRPGVIGLIDGKVWVANHHAWSIGQIDPASSSVVRTITVGNPGAGAH